MDGQTVLRAVDATLKLQGLYWTRCRHKMNNLEMLTSQREHWTEQLASSRTNTPNKRSTQKGWEV